MIRWMWDRCYRLKCFLDWRICVVSEWSCGRLRRANRLVTAGGNCQSR